MTFLVRPLRSSGAWWRPSEARVRLEAVRLAAGDDAGLAADALRGVVEHAHRLGRDLLRHARRLDRRGRGSRGGARPGEHAQRPPTAGVHGVTSSSFAAPSARRRRSARRRASSRSGSRPRARAPTARPATPVAIGADLALVARGCPGRCRAASAARSAPCRAAATRKASCCSVQPKHGCAEADRPGVRHLAEVQRRAARVRRRALAAHLVQALALAVPLVAELLHEAAGVEVRAARAVLVDGAAVGEGRPALLVERRQRAERDVLQRRAEEDVRVGRAAGQRDDRLALEDRRRARRARSGSGRRRGCRPTTRRSRWR